jgi:hypothetical protein
MQNIKELRSFLGETMKQLREGSLDIEKARTISDLGQVIVNSAKVEVDYIKAAKVQDATDFIAAGIIKKLPSQPQDIVPEVKQERPKAEYSNKQHH